MNKDKIFSALVVILAVAGIALASTWDEAKPIHRGTNPMVANIVPLSTTGTALWPGGYGQLDASCRNNSEATVWIGTVAYSQAALLHPNVANGFPLLSSETFKLDGMFTGIFYGTCDTGKICNVRCIYGNVTR